MRSLALDELNSHLNTFIQSLDYGATTQEIIAGFRKLHEHSISKAINDLADMALGKLVNANCTRRPLKLPGEPDLFAGFGVPATIPIRDEEGRVLHTPIGKVPISQAEIWAYGRKRAPQPTAKQIEVQRLIEDIKPHAIDENTAIEDALGAARAEDGKRKV